MYYPLLAVDIAPEHLDSYLGISDARSRLLGVLFEVRSLRRAAERGGSETVVEWCDKLTEEAALCEKHLKWLRSTLITAPDAAPNADQVDMSATLSTHVLPPDDTTTV